MSVTTTSEHFLVQADRLIDWASLAPSIEAIGARVEAEVPRAAVKMLLLARWYGMSEPTLLEACQDRISFRRFLGLSATDGDDARLAETYRLQVTQAPAEAEDFVQAVDAQLLARGYTIRHGMGTEAAVVPLAPEGALEPARMSETAFFQPGEIADLLRQGERVLVRGGAKVSTKPPYGAVPVELTPPPRNEITLLQAIVEWPWGVTVELPERLSIGRDPVFCPFASELQPYLHVSRKHAELTVCPEGVWVRDLRSRNGTFVNDDQIPSGQAYLVDADARIRFGPYCVMQLKLRH